MQVIINGEQQRLADSDLTIGGLLELNKIESPEMVAVQLNGRAVERDTYGTVRINEGDVIDFLYFMGGGERRWQGLTDRNQARLPGP